MCGIMFVSGAICTPFCLFGLLGILLCWLPLFSRDRLRVCPDCETVRGEIY